MISGKTNLLVTSPISYLSFPLPTGPLIGGHFEPGDDAPRAVSKNYFNEVCPPSKRTILDTEEVNNESIRYSETAGASFMFDRWVEKLNSIDNPCVEIAQESFQLFEKIGRAHV